MQNKTCGECRFYEHPAGQCAKVIEYNNCHITDKSCEYFEPKPTNGDLIRQMSNKELATWGMYDLGTCPTFEKQQSCARRGECSASEIEECWLNWLNAPVDSEVCVAENGECVTQADLCKADDIESEGKTSDRIDRYCLTCGNVTVADAGYYAGSSFYHCETCGRRGMSDMFPRATVFHKITSSPEVLAPRFVYHVTSFLDGLDKPKKIWYSTLIQGRAFASETEAKKEQRWHGSRRFAMIDLEKVWLAIMLAVIAGGIFMLGVGLGYSTGYDRQVEKQKTLLIEQNNLLKENIELNNELLKLKEVAELGRFSSVTSALRRSFC